MRVTVCQLANEADALEAHWGELVSHVELHRSDLVVLPEMPFHPWLAASRRVDPAAWLSAERAHARWLERLGELEPATVVTTSPSHEGAERRNRALVRAPGRTPEPVHDKHYLPDEAGFWEATWYAPGDGTFEPFRAGSALAGVMICTEMWFLQHARAYGQEGIDLLVVPRATPAETLDKWIAGGRTAAVVAGAYCLSSNPWNPPGSGADLGGGGWIIDPDGELLATTTERRPFATLELDLAVAAAAKRTYPRYVKE